MPTYYNKIISNLLYNKYNNNNNNNNSNLKEKSLKERWNNIDKLSSLELIIKYKYKYKYLYK